MGMILLCYSVFSVGCRCGFFMVCMMVILVGCVFLC